MRCARCGFFNSPPLRYCGNCGALLAPHRVCPSCDFRNPSNLNYCAQCGADLRKDVAGRVPQPLDEPHRRHLTVLFCDLVGSTALSERLDPEELSEVILAYREAAVEAIDRLGGYVARYLGDGILVYFGYPRAHGDDAIRAVHAALQIRAAIGRLAPTLKMTHDIDIGVHIGVHTGLVVAGELARGAAREEAAIVGETPNVAARLEQLAGPNSVLVSGVTQALIKNHFECRAIGETRLEGLSRPMGVFEVMCARSPESKSELQDAMKLTRLAGRENELTFLGQRWRQVEQGMGQAVSIAGEPGIGKSRLVRAFADSLMGTDHLRIAFYCSPHFSNSALFPVIDYLNRWLGTTADNRPESKLNLLADAVSAVGLPSAEVVPILASLLSLPISSPYEVPDLSAKVQRERTMEFLLEWLMRQAAERPVLLVMEDLHWADASSLELVLLLLNQILASRTLLLLTFRPDFRPPWGMHSNFAHLALSRLKTEHVHAMIENITGGKPLPEVVRDQLVKKTDGVPLFIEELTKAVIESGVLTEGEEGYELSASAIELDIPISLHDTLMARLDALNSAKLVAQRAAAIGREFSYELLRAITPMSEAELHHALALLVEAELLYQRGLPPRANYVFKHSMIQEAAYRSLLRSKRREYHRQIAEVLRSQFPQLVETQPELVAHHYSAAQMAADAASYWRRAGERALATSATVEALAHINKGLEELAACPRSSARIREEVLLDIAMGAALTSTRGYAAPEVEQTYARARELCRELDDASQLFRVLRGLHTYYLVHGPLRVACDMVEQLSRMAEQTGDRLQRIEAHRRLGWCLFCMGKMEAGRTHLGIAIQEYDRAQSSQHIVIYGSDPAIIGLVNTAWLEWFAGRPASAKRHSDQAIQLGRELSHGHSLAYALGMSAALYQCLDDPPKTATLAEETISLAEKRGFPYWVAWETSLLGWALAAQGKVDIGVEKLHTGLVAYRATGAELFRPYMLGLLAQISLNTDRFDDGLAHCDEALSSALRTDVHFFDSEIHRLKGELIWSRDRDVSAAEKCFEEAIAVARDQGAGMLELRGAVSLASLYQRQGRCGAALALLSGAVDKVDQSYMTPHLGTAIRLLYELR